MDFNIYRYDDIMESKKWVKEIPFLKFPSDWEVKIIPPFAGAVIRFLIKKEEKEVSCYLDCYNNLGYVNEPYWEIYPYKEDTARFLMNDIDGLLLAIEEQLNKEESN